MIRKMWNWMSRSNPSSSDRTIRRAALNLQELESRDVPAVFFMQMDSPPEGVAGDTLATHTGALYLNPGVASIANDKLMIDATDRVEAVRLGLAGGVTMRFGAVAAHHRFQMSPTVTVGSDIANATANNRSYAVVLVPEAEGGDGVSKFRVLLEDLAGIPGTVSDGDYNDRYWDVRVTTQGDDAIGPSLVFQNASSTALSYLKVGKWENAFAPTEGGGAPTLKNNFIDLDPDRFTVRVVDNRYAQGGARDGQGKPQSNGAYNPTNDPTVVDKLSVYVYTSVDAGAWITLTEEGAGSGVFRSMTLLAVSNTVDDAYELDTVRDGHEDDRTFKVELGHSDTANNILTAAYEVNPGGFLIKDIKAPTEKVVKLHINILKLANGTAVATPAVVATYVTAANEIYAQVGIRIELVGQMNEVNQPVNGVGVDLSNGFSDFPDPTLNNNMIVPTDEEKSLLEANLRSPTVNNLSDDVEVYYVNYLTSNSLGEAFPASIVANASFADSVVSKGDTHYMVLAHEIAHLLLNNGDHLDGTVGVNKVNLMASPYQVSGLVTDSRRITAAQATTMLSARANLLIVP